MTSAGLIRSGLRTLGLADRYRSDKQDVVRGFYVPALSVASGYSRAVGYFTSTSLALFARGLERFARRGGTMRLIASPHLEADDIIDIERGYDIRAVIERAALRALTSEAGERVLDGLGAVGRLIASGNLDIKLAFVEQDGRIGLYHEKIGIFRDESGDQVAFTGSANETLGGLLANFESVEVYQSWKPGDGARALRIEADFEDLWHNRTEGLRIEAFPDVLREHLVELGRTRQPYPDPVGDQALDFDCTVDHRAARLSLPPGLEVRRYQRDAVEAWLGNQGCGILKMATGTGKTKTALVAAYQLSQVLRRREEPLVVVVVAPLQHLVDQWIDEVELFGVRPIGVYENSQRWLPLVEEQLAAARLGRRPVVVLVATNASFAGDRFQSVLRRINVPMLLIVDEVHNLGAVTYRKALPGNATYRLALSATPERWFDDEGTDALIDYFGPVVLELGLGEAIERGALCQYTYVPRLVTLTDEETARYVDLTGRIAKLLASGDRLDTADPQSPMGYLLRRRAAVLGHAAGKTGQLRDDLLARRDQWFQLVYCAEGSRPVDQGEPEGANQVAEVVDLIGNRLDLAVHPYTAVTTRAERRSLLQRFARGDDLKVLVAMRCLDEGVDIPDARVAYLLASSSNPRQFIQRRGRILRRAVDKDHAEIVDYIAVPQDGAPVNFEIERNLLIRELQRVDEFGKLARNYEAVLNVLRPLKARYQLMHL